MIDFTVTHREEGVLSDPVVADVTEHLVAEFGARVDRSAISGVVLRGLHDLQCSPAAACVVGLERLTRDRLRALVDEEPLARHPGIRTLRESRSEDQCALWPAR